MPDLTDVEMIAKARGGDRMAFRTLVERHHGFVFSVSFRLLGNRAEAEDVTQETFIRLWKNLDRYDGRAKVTTWLYKIATNLCLDILRSLRRRHERRSEDTEGNQTLHAVSGADDAILAAELRAGIVALADQLTPKQKAVFVLRDLEGLDMDEISQVLSMSKEQLKSNLYYARVKMSGLITQYYSERKNKTP